MPQNPLLILSLLLWTLVTPPLQLLVRAQCGGATAETSSGEDNATQKKIMSYTKYIASEAAAVLNYGKNASNDDLAKKSMLPQHTVLYCALPD